MLSSTNFWMCLTGLVYLFAGVFVLRRALRAAGGWDRLIRLGSVFVAASLAVFAPEHLYGGPTFIQEVVPSWMPARSFWPAFVGCALLAAATSLTVGKFVRLSTTLLGSMFLLFVCTIYVPGVFADPTNRLAWALFLRDSSFAGGAFAFAGLHGRSSSPRKSEWMIVFGRTVIAVAAIFFGVEHFLHPEFAPGVPLTKITPSWVPFPTLWGYLAGAVLLIAGTCLAMNRKSRIAAASIGALMAFLTLFLYVPILILARGGPAPAINEALNYVADTLLFGGAALVLASALPGDRVEKRTSEGRRT